MIFKTVNNQIDKSNYKIDIKNIDLASGHWGSEKEIINYLDKIEMILLNKDKFDKNMILHTLTLAKENARIEETKFFRIPEENKIIMMVTTDVPKFKDFEMFSREMSILFKKEKFAFSIIEIVRDDAKLLANGEKKVPEHWQFDKYTTERFEKLRHYS